MRLDEKQRVAEELHEALKESGTIYLTDFSGLNVKAITEFRSQLRDQGIRYRVVKNTIMRRALEGLDLPDLSEHLEGPTALIMSESDPVAPAKVVKDFAKEHDDRPVIKIGVVDRKEVAADQIRRMADLPSRDELLGSIAGGLTAGVGGIAGALSALIRDITHMIGEVAKRNEAT
jgi:large subunit ribosomal protein L10